MGIRIRYLPDKDETLWFGGRFLISVVMEYVLPLFAQVLFSSSIFLDFVVSKVTPTIHTRLGYKMFLMFAALNIGAMAPFSLCALLFSLVLYQVFFTRSNSILPETKGRSLEEMDIIFGAVSVEARAENIARQGQGASCPSLLHLPPH